MTPETWFLIYIICCVYPVSHLSMMIGATVVPNTVQLGGAIIAAVESNAEHSEQSQRRTGNVFHDSDIDTFFDEMVLQLSNSGIADIYRIGGGRGKQHKRKKIIKMLYPLMVGMFIAKIVLIPLILKILTALSTSSFVMGKIALITSGLLALKWIFSGIGNSGSFGRERLEIVHFTPTHNNGGGDINSWNDMSSSESNWYAGIKHPHKYIPLGSHVNNDAVYRYAQHGFEDSNGDYDKNKPFL